MIGAMFLDHRSDLRNLRVPPVSGFRQVLEHCSLGPRRPSIAGRLVVMPARPMMVGSRLTPERRAWRRCLHRREFSVINPNSVANLFQRNEGIITSGREIRAEDQLDVRFVPKD
jgi:hypothetical protein